MYGRAKYGTDIYGGVFYSHSVSFSLSGTMSATETVRFNETMSVSADLGVSISENAVYNEAFSCYVDITVLVNDIYTAFNPDPNNISPDRYIPIDYLDRKATIMYDLRSVLIEERYNNAVSVA